MPDQVTRYFYDTEFLDDGRTIDLISIGIVCEEDGREYYAVAPEIDDRWAEVMAHPFLPDNVVPYLPTETEIKFGGEAWPVLDLDHPTVKPRDVIATEVRDFLLAGEHEVELWAYVAAYDHVVYAQLFGPMAKLPEGLPWFTRDLKDMHVRLGKPELPEQQTCQHHALHDARHDLAMWRHMTAIEQELARA